MAYCGSGDLLLGNVPIPANASKYIDAASEEMDSILGLQYVTPVLLIETEPKQRPGFLLLKRINAWLATGRLLMALDAAGEDDQVHQYAERMVKDALGALGQISDGSILLPGADPIVPDQHRPTGPVASWADDASPVEEYQSTFGNDASRALKGPAQIFFGTVRRTW